MTMKKQAMQHTNTKGKLVWALPILFSTLSACVGPVREGDVDWEEFQGLVTEGAVETNAIDDEIALLEAELKLLADSVTAKEGYVEQGVDAGRGNVSERWHRMKEVENLLGQLLVRRAAINTSEKGLGLSRESTIVALEADVDEFLVDAWKRTRKGARNLHFNYGVGASTDNTVVITGTIQTPDPNVTLPFSGVLNGESMKTDSSDIGFEYYFKDDWAVEAGLIFGNAVRDEESVNYGVLSYDDEKHVGSFVGLKYVHQPINKASAGGLNGRARLFANARLGLMEEYEFSGAVSFGGPGSIPVDLESSGDAYFTLGLGAGVLYAWTDYISIELGVNLVNSISDMDGEWSFSGADGAGGTYSGDYTTDVSMTRAYLGVLFGF